MTARDERNTDMVSKKVTVKNPTGLHLRPAGILCNEALEGMVNAVEGGLGE